MKNLLQSLTLLGGTPRSEKEVSMFKAETAEGYTIRAPGNLVINTLWAWIGAMGVSRMNGIASPAYHVYEPTKQLASSYLDALVRLPVFAPEVTRYSKGIWSSRLRLYPESFFENFLPIPPLSEQQEITEFLASECEKFDALQVATANSIKLLKARRTSLIAAAVTGQIDVGENPCG